MAALREPGVIPPGALPAAARGRQGDHVFLLELAATLAAQDPPVTLVLEANALDRKLGACSRSQAVARSRDLGLLEG